MSFFHGFGDELMKLASIEDKVLGMVRDDPNLGKALASGAGEGFGRGAGEKIVEKAGPSVAGAAVGGLAGKAFFRRGALGALAGLGVVHRKKLLAAAKKAKEKAEELRSKK